MKGRLKTCLTFIIAPMLLLTACDDTSNHTTTHISTASIPKPTKAIPHAAHPKKKTPQFPMTVKIGDWQYTIVSIQKSKTIADKQGVADTAQGIYYFVDIKITNMTSREDLTDPDMFHMIADRKDIWMDEEATTAREVVDGGDDPYLSASIYGGTNQTYNPGQTLEADVTFDVPVHTRHLTLKLFGNCTDQTPPSVQVKLF